MRVNTDWGDQRQLRHKTPCSECPFRKNSMKGFLGGYDLSEYATPAGLGMPTTCHQHDHGGAEHPDSRFCAGSCSVIANDPNIKPIAGYGEIIAKVGPREDTFATMEEFTVHHLEMNRYTLYGR
jgi:hypothetical protein